MFLSHLASLYRENNAYAENVKNSGGGSTQTYNVLEPHKSKPGIKNVA